MSLFVRLVTHYGSNESNDSLGVFSEHGEVVDHGNYHVIVVNECSGVQHPMISLLFIPKRTSYQSILCPEIYHVMLCKIP